MTNTNRITTTPDEPVDRVLTTFFRQQMPNPWPPAPAVGSVTLPARVVYPSSSAARSRWALAASVALLVGGCWYLSGHLTDGKARPGTGLEGGTASPTVIDKHLGKAPAMPKPAMP